MADISTDWYTWLEQGRGGNPSAEVLERLAQALRLNQLEKEHLFLLARGHCSDNDTHTDTSSDEKISAMLQRLLNNLGDCPAYIRNAAWDIMAWNKTLEVLWQPLISDLDDASRSNVLAMFFAQAGDEPDTAWLATAQQHVAMFRAAMIRSGSPLRSRQLVQDLSSKSAVFRTLWQSSEIADGGVRAKTISLQAFGPFKFDYCEFRVEGQADLTMAVFSPASSQDAIRIREIVSAHNTKAAQTESLP